MKDYCVTVRFPAELYKRLEVAAASTGTRETDLILGAVERALDIDEASQCPYALANKAGLIGAVRGAVRDLSTNPKYFDGFGSKSRRKGSPIV